MKLRISGPARCFGFAQTDSRGAMRTALVALAIAGSAIAGDYLPGHVLKVSDQPEWSDCEWAVPCTKTTLEVETERFLLFLVGAGWKGQHRNTFVAGQSITVLYTGRSGASVKIDGGKKAYLFKVMKHEER